jgi:hypothetical protein
MEFIKTVKIDISCATPTARIREKQLDNGTRTIYATFYNSETNEDVTFTASETFEFRIQRADGALVTSTAEYQNNQIVVTLTSEMLGVCGRARCDIRAKNGENILSGGSFFIDVEPVANGTVSKGFSGDLTNTRMISRDDYDALAQKSTNTLYIVTDDDDTVTLYLGEDPIAAMAGSSDIRLHGHKIYLFSPTDSPDSYNNPITSYVTAESNGDILITRNNRPRGSSTANHSYIRLAQDDITLSVAGNNLVLSADGLKLNGKSLGGGVNIGGTIGIMPNALSTSIIGELEEET